LAQGREAWERSAEGLSRSTSWLPWSSHPSSEWGPSWTQQGKAAEPEAQSAANPDTRKLLKITGIYEKNKKKT